MDILNWFISHFFDWSPSMGDIFMIFFCILYDQWSLISNCPKESIVKDPPNIENILSFKIFKISVLRSGLQGSSQYWQYSWFARVSKYSKYLFLDLVSSDHNNFQYIGSWTLMFLILVLRSCLQGLNIDNIRSKYSKYLVCKITQCWSNRHCYLKI